MKSSISRRSCSNNFLLRVAACVGLPLAMIGCRQPAAAGLPSAATLVVSNTYTGPDFEVFQVSSSGATSVDYTLDLGANVRDVYFIFSNVSATQTDTAPTVIGNSIQTAAWEVAAPLADPASLPSGDQAGNTRGIPLISEFNRNPFAHLEPSSVARNLLMPAPPPPQFDTIGSVTTFLTREGADANGDGVPDTLVSIPATCRAVVEDAAISGKRLNVWVADDCWTATGTGKAYLVDGTMVAALADRFLKTSADNDIHDWIGGIFGEEWGAHSYANLIADNNEITILLMDIDRDNATNGGTMGYFWAKDNFKQTSISYSNERIMFYLDAVMFAEPDLPTWSIDDYWPQESVSTLAHEFQHMIHYYQKIVKHGLATGTDTWINEMCSLVAEDFVSVRLAIPGPRGIVGSDLGDGTAPISKGRLPRFNQFNDNSLTDWYSGSDITELLKDYSSSYAFGAFLSRNFDGAKLFRLIVQNGYVDTRAVTDAAQTLGYPYDFAALLRAWAAAGVVSDRIVAVRPYAFNKTAGGFTDSLGFVLGAVNLFNYSTIPRIYSAVDWPSTSLPKAASRIYRAGAGISGSHTWSIVLGSNTRLTVVVRAPL